MPGGRELPWCVRAMKALKAQWGADVVLLKLIVENGRGIPDMPLHRAVRELRA